MQLFDLPPGWKSVPMWSVAARKDRKGYSDAELLSVYREYGVIRKSDRDDNHNVESEDLSNYKFVRKGDLVLNKMKTWQGSLGVSPYEGIVSPAYYVCELSKDLYAPYIHYLLRSAPYIAMYGARSKGIRIGQWDLPYEEFREIPVLVPPIEEQRRIADHLDMKLRILEKIITSKTKQIENIESSFRSFTSQVLNELVYEDFAPISHFCNLINGYPFDSESFSHVGDVPLVRIRDLKAQEFELYVPEPVPKSQIIQNGDLVIGMDGQFSPVIWKRGRAALNQRVCLIRSKDNADLNFIKYAITESLESYAKQVEATTVAHISSTDILRLRVPNVDPSLQISEAKRISEYEEKSVSAINLLSKSINLLNEYKASLISSCVTGNIHRNLENE